MEIAKRIIFSQKDIECIYHVCGLLCKIREEKIKEFEKLDFKELKDMFDYFYEYLEDSMEWDI